MSSWIVSRVLFMTLRTTHLHNSIAIRSAGVSRRSAAQLRYYTCKSLFEIHISNLKSLTLLCTGGGDTEPV